MNWSRIKERNASFGGATGKSSRFGMSGSILFSLLGIFGMSFSGWAKYDVPRGVEIVKGDSAVNRNKETAEQQATQNACFNLSKAKS